LASFGERLKRTRENKKMSLDDVARATKISTRMLAALEEEKFEQLPGGIFNKGFVRAYARHLELNEEQAIRDYTAAAGSLPAELKSEDAELRAIAERKEKELAGRPRSQEVPWGIVAALLLVLALSLSIWGFLTRERFDSEQARLAAVRTRDASPTQRNEDSSAPPPSAPVPTEVVHRQAVSDEADDSSAGSAQPPSSALVVLVVSAHDDSWLTIIADGQPLFQGTLAAGRQQSISAQNEVVLKCGNIGGLDITFNGSKLASQGAAAEVKTLTFTPSGLQETGR
jgi:cytoskeleton protein RodZ